MADRYHCVDGVWMLDEDSPKFRSVDVVDLGITWDRSSRLWHVEAVLKDGTVLCPDLTCWPTVAEAGKEAQIWSSNFELGINDTVRTCKTCEYTSISSWIEPCLSCNQTIGRTNWEPMSMGQAAYERATEGMKLSRARAVLEAGESCHTSECANCTLYDDWNECNLQEYASKICKALAAELKFYTAKYTEMQKKIEELEGLLKEEKND